VTRILLRAGKDPFEVIPAHDRRAWHAGGFFATNTGNLLFGDAVHRLLSVPSAEIDVDGYATERTEHTDASAAAIGERYDHLVLPLANALRREWAPVLDRLSALIERLTIPVTVVGMGAQLPLDDLSARLPDEVEAAQRRFVRAVLGRSPRIGVRGQITADHLARLGFGAEHVEVIGCPSLFLRDSSPRVRDERAAGPLRPEDGVILTIGTTTKPEILPFIDRAAEEFPHLVYVAQREYDFALLQWGRDAAGLDPRLPVNRDHRLYREDRIRLFLDSRAWVDFAGRHRFAVGTRLHGSVAAIVGGTPAVMVAHDSRTLEVADYHAIPHRTLPSVPIDAGVADLFELADYDAFHAGTAECWARLTGFLDEAGLAHVGPAGDSAYDERLAAVVPAPPVTTMRAPGEEGIRRIEDRISALQQALATQSRWSRRRIERLLARRTPAPAAPPAHRGLFRRR
jgi:hypothetical protein